MEGWAASFAPWAGHAPFALEEELRAIPDGFGVDGDLRAGSQHGKRLSVLRLGSPFQTSKTCTRPTAEAWSRTVNSGDGKERSMPARGKAVLEVSFGSAATPVLPGVAFAALHADLLERIGEKTWRATFRLGLGEETYGRGPSNLCTWSTGGGPPPWRSPAPRSPGR
jgi:hypothetical protein